MVRAAYGLKEDGREFRNHLRDCMKALTVATANVDHDVWIKKAETDDGTKYYEYLLLYVDDCLAT